MDRRALEDAGFTPEQAEALFECFSVRHHHHDIEDVDGLEEELADLSGVEVDDDDDD